MNNYKRNSEPWLELVHKELKGKAMGELAFKVDADLEIDPIKAYLHDSNDDKIVSSLPNPNFLQHVNITSAIENEVLLECLEGGATGFYLKIGKNFELNNLKQLFSGILIEIITTIFDITQSQFSQLELEDELEKMAFPYENYQIITLSTVQELDISMGNVIEPITKALNSYLALKNQKHTLFKLIPSGGFFVDIAAIRAVRSLFVNLGIDSPPKILAVVNSNLNDFNESLISYTSTAVASTIGGADLICLKTDNNDLGKMKLLRNIPHLLSLESKINEHYDAVEGSRNLMYMTDNIGQSVWSELKEI